MYLVYCSIFEIWRIIGLIFTVDRGCIIIITHWLGENL